MQYYKNTARLLPPQLAARCLAVPPAQWGGITEIRLHSGLAPLLTSGGVTRPLQELTGTPEQTICHEDLQRIFQHLCRYSAFAQENRLRNGFFTLEGGQRVGIAAQAIWREGRLQQPENISSMNIRVARDLPLYQPEIWRQLVVARQGLLVCGAPGSGKTTVLRGIARLSAGLRLRTAVIDERGELFPLSGAGFAFAQPLSCNVLSDYPKGEGMRQALRSLSPQVLVCDELSGENIRPLAETLNSGVGFVSTLHAATRQELQTKTQYRALCALHGLQKVVFLSAKNPGEIAEICHADS